MKRLALPARRVCWTIRAGWSGAGPAPPVERCVSEASKSRGGGEGRPIPAGDRPWLIRHVPPLRGDLFTGVGRPVRHFRGRKDMLLLGLLLMAATAAFTGLLIAVDVSGGLTATQSHSRPGDPVRPGARAVPRRDRTCRSTKTSGALHAETLARRRQNVTPWPNAWKEARHLWALARPLLGASHLPGH